ASAIHIAVVDPGVGSERRPIVVVTGHGTFVGPDNGIFTYVLRAEQTPTLNPDLTHAPVWAGGMWSVAPNWAGSLRSQGSGIGDRGSDPQETRSPIPDPRSLVRAYHLVNPDYWLPSISTTFHARDIF